MSIAQVIRVINQMQDDGVVERYAIGGLWERHFILNPWPRWKWIFLSRSVKVNHNF
ncbi:MAG: hypothetical protein ACREOI_27940 [bacterium]